MNDTPRSGRTEFGRIETGDAALSAGDRVRHKRFGYPARVIAIRDGWVRFERLPYGAGRSFAQCGQKFRLPIHEFQALYA